MKTIESLVPGSSAWLKSRSASKAPAMMGVSSYKSRSALLKEMATGIKEEVDARTQERFDGGHKAEASARAIAEEIIGDDLPPEAGSTDDGYLTASFDGITFAGNVAWEHKAWNVTLAEKVRNGDPGEYGPQLDQQILVGGLDYVLFMVSDGTREKCVSMEYRSTPERAKALLAAWRQFDADLAAYQHVEPAQVATAAPINELPALMVEITGAVTASNLTQWKAVVTERIGGINTDLQTDQDFADADEMVKFLDNGEKRIDLVKAQAQAQASDIDAVFRALDEIKASMRTKRLELDKLVTKRKESIRGEIAAEAAKKIADHVVALNKRIGMALPPIPGNFAVVMKNKRTVASLRDAVDTELARLKISASEIADKMEINLNTLRAAASNHPYLFNDSAALVFKDADDLALVIKSRIQYHEAAEAKRQEQAAVTKPAAQPAGTTTAAEIGGYTVPQAVAAAPAHMGITGSAKIIDEIDDILRGLTLADLIRVRDFSAQIAGQREKVAA